MQRSVYHKYAEVGVEVPNGMECNDIHEWLTNNENLYIDKIDEAISEANFEYGSGVNDYTGMTDTNAESEWRFEYGDKTNRYGGHL